MVLMLGKFQMHNRFWADDNVYAEENGGKYKFMVEHEVRLWCCRATGALPLFWVTKSDFD